MPELPEVETVRRTLLPRVVGCTVLAAKLFRRDVLVAPGDPAGGFSRQRNHLPPRPAPFTPADLLERCTIRDVLRRGKQLAILAHDPDGAERALIIQLGMSGQLFLHEAESPGHDPPAHVHAMWTLVARASRSTCLLFRDPRRFGGLRILRSREALDAHWRELGPDALDLTADELLNAARGSTRAMKALLMDQAVVAGIGNIYADEALFRAGIRPARMARRLKPPEAESLAAAVRAVLSEAVQARGSTLRDYRDADGREGDFQSRHAVYGRGGEPCIRCRGLLRSATLAQRTTVWCSSCQR